MIWSILSSGSGQIDYIVKTQLLLLVVILLNMRMANRTTYCTFRLYILLLFLSDSLCFRHFTLLQEKGAYLPFLLYSGSLAPALSSSGYTLNATPNDKQSSSLSQSTSITGFPGAILWESACFEATTKTILTPC